jgi:hypothetical protein
MYYAWHIVVATKKPDCMSQAFLRLGYRVSEWLFLGGQKAVDLPTTEQKDAERKEGVEVVGEEDILQGEQKSQNGDGHVGDEEPAVAGGHR